MKTLVSRIQRAFGVELPARLRAFYEEGEYEDVQDFVPKGLSVTPIRFGGTEPACVERDELLREGHTREQLFELGVVDEERVGLWLRADLSRAGCPVDATDGYRFHPIARTFDDFVAGLRPLPHSRTTLRKKTSRAWESFFGTKLPARLRGFIDRGQYRSFDGGSIRKLIEGGEKRSFRLRFLSPDLAESFSHAEMAWRAHVDTHFPIARLPESFAMTGYVAVDLTKPELPVSVFPTDDDFFAYAESFDAFLKMITR